MTTDGTGKQQDKSSAEGQGTSAKEPETYTKDEVQKQVSDALSKAGRTDKALETRETALKAREDKIAEAERKREEAELEAARDDPDKLSLLQQKKALKEERRQINEDRTKLEADKLTHQAEVEAAKAANLEIAIWNIATELKVDPSELKGTITELNLETEEQFRIAAKKLSKGKTETVTKPDSGVTTGGTKSKITPDEKLQEAFKKLKK